MNKLFSILLIVLLVASSLFGMKIPDGSTDKWVYFIAVDATDMKTLETGFSSFTVYYSINAAGASGTAMTTPTINETDTTNMAGAYELLIDEADMTTIDTAGDDNEELLLYITHAGMRPVIRAIEIYRPKITEGQTVAAASGNVQSNVKQLDDSSVQQTSGHIHAFDDAGAALSTLTASDNIGINWADVTNQGTSVTLNNTTVGITTLNSDMVSEPLTAQQTEDEAVDALEFFKLDELIKEGVTTSLQTAVHDNSVIGYMLASVNVSAYIRTTDSLEDLGENIIDIETDTTVIGALGAGLTGIPWNAAWDTEIESEVDDALGGGSGTALSAIPWNSSWDTEVQSEVADAIVVYKLDHLVYAADGDDPVNDSIMAMLAATGGDWSTFVKGTDSLQAIRNRGDAEWTTATTVGLSDNAITAAKVHANAWQELIELFFDFDATATYATANAGSVVKQIADNARVAAAITTTVATGNTNKSFTLTAGTTEDDAYEKMQITVTDANGKTSTETRRITAWTSGRVVTVDTAFSFIPAASDIVIVERAYLGVSATATIPPRIY